MHFTNNRYYQYAHIGTVTDSDIYISTSVFCLLSVSLFQTHMHKHTLKALKKDGKPPTATSTMIDGALGKKASHISITMTSIKIFLSFETSTTNTYKTPFLGCSVCSLGVLFSALCHFINSHCTQTRPSLLILTCSTPVLHTNGF